MCFGSEGELSGISRMSKYRVGYSELDAVGPNRNRFLLHFSESESLAILRGMYEGPRAMKCGQNQIDLILHI